jgi:putative NAD(P)-binding protein
VSVETDYLVVGAGASGMAFTDTLVANSDADVVIVDRRHRPGGHWNDDYKFIRLHQPSAFYGVDSRPLGLDRIDETGPNAGFYERATGAEICDYYSRFLDEQLLPTGRVRFLGMTDYVGDASGDHQVTSRLTGTTTTVRVRRRLVDATYIATTIPSMHKPGFSVDPGARFIPPNDLVDITDPGSGYTVIGAGKTSMDTCWWLLDQGVDPETIRWIRPREPWTVDRSWLQGLKLVDSIAEYLALLNEAAIEAKDARDFVLCLEAKGIVRRLDPEVEPTVYRGPTLNDLELATLRRITKVVKLGRVTHVGIDRIDLSGGSIPTDPTHVHVDCTASGIGLPPARTIFEPDRITIQRVQTGIDPFSAALIGFVEATDRSNEEKNRLCPPVATNGDATDFAVGILGELSARARWLAEPDVREWFMNTRLNPFRGAQEYLSDVGRSAVMRMVQSTGSAIENLERIVALDESVSS